MCQYLQVSPSGFYAARGRPESARHIRLDRRLQRLVRAIDSTRAMLAVWHARVFTTDLIEQEERVSRKRVIRLMHRKTRLEARAQAMFKCTTIERSSDQPMALANLLDRCFEAPGPNQRWVGDTTEFVIRHAAASC